MGRCSTLLTVGFALSTLQQRASFQSVALPLLSLIGSLANNDTDEVVIDHCIAALAPRRSLDVAMRSFVRRLHEKPRIQARYFFWGLLMIPVLCNFWLSRQAWLQQPSTVDKDRERPTLVIQLRGEMGNHLSAI